MATDRRQARVAELIKREISQMLITGIKDERLSSTMVSVTEVDISRDLRHARVFVSFYGPDALKAEALIGLESATSYVRRELGRRLQMRNTPDITFLEDQALARGSRVLTLIEQLSLPEDLAKEQGESS